MTNFDDFSMRYQDHTKAIAEANVLNKAVVFDALVAAGITRLTIEFDGQGDSGQLDGVAAYSGETQVTLPLTSITLRQGRFDTDGLTTHTAILRDAVEILCYDYLEQEYAGWENNDGACGEFMFDVAAREIHLDMNVRFSDSTHHNHTF
jgi:hypothetical protein